MRSIFNRPDQGIASHPLLVAFVLAATASGAVAATFDVDRVDDEPNAIQCTLAPLDCSLRGAVRAANLTPGAPHTLVLQNGTYELTVLGSNEDNALTGDLDIRVDLVVQGAGSDTTLIQMDNVPQNQKDRIFDILSSDVEFHGVSIRLGGNVDNGGGIYAVFSNITLENSWMSINSAYQRGGAIYCYPGSLTITNSLIHNGSAGDIEGGGIYARECPVTVSGSEIRQSNAGSAGDPGRGGAIYFDGESQHSLMITNTIMRQNDASLSGGAIFIIDGTGQVTGSTIRDNFVGDPNDLACGDTAIGTGGGVTVAADAALTLTDTTLLANCAGQFGGGAQVLGSLTLDSSTVRCNQGAGGGGGFWVPFSGFLAATNTTVSQNASPNGAGISTDSADIELTNSTFAEQLGDGLAIRRGFTDMVTTNTVYADPCLESGFGVITSGGGNVQAMSGDCVPSPLVTDQTTDPELGPLGSFGGPTQTHLPLPGSPVLGAAVEVSCPATDQRGFARVDCDSGSVERQGTDPAPIFINDFECMGTGLWSSVSP